MNLQLRLLIIPATGRHAGRYAVDGRCCSHLAYMKVFSYDNVKPSKTGATASEYITQLTI